MQKLRKILFVLGVFAVGIAGATQAEARQYKKVVNGREVVVHTNPIPVALHRMVPPQHGRHVTEREVRSGSVPNSGRVVSKQGR